MKKVDWEELKEVRKKILDGISLKVKINAKIIGGFDVLFAKNKIICMAVVLDLEGNIIEKKHIIHDDDFPYKDGFLAFKSGPIIVDTYRSLENKPDVLIMMGDGVLSLDLGVASYVGVILNKPAIGVAAKLICGKKENSNIIFGGEVKGRIFSTKEFANPIFVSPGHGLSVKSTVEIIEKTLNGYKLPKPLYLAHKFGVKIKRDLNV